MSLTIPPPPTPTDPGATTGGPSTHEQAWALVNAKYADAGAWAAWAAGILNNGLIDISTTLGSNTVEDDIAALTTEIGEILTFTPNTITADSAAFSDTLLTDLKARLVSDIATYSTGLGSAEAAMFARETARQNAARAAAYTEITTQFSARGFDMPPGALLAKQTELNNESGIRLSDSSAAVMAESARLAADYNKHTLAVSVQLLQILGNLFDNQKAREFEAQKQTAILAVEGYKSSLGLVTAKADIILKKGDLALSSKYRQMALELETLKSLSLGFQQMIASAMNGVNVGGSFSYSGSANTSYTGT